MGSCTSDFFKEYVDWAQKLPSSTSVPYVEFFLQVDGETALQYQGSLAYRPAIVAPGPIPFPLFPEALVGFGQWIHDVNFAKGTMKIDRVNVAIHLDDPAVVSLRFKHNDGTHSAARIEEADCTHEKKFGSDLGVLSGTGSDGKRYSLLLRKNEFDPRPPR